MFNWFNNFKIRGKLILAFLIIVSLTIIISVIDLLSQHYMQTITTELLDVYEQVARLSLKSRNAMLMARRNEKDYLLRYKELGFTKARAKYVAPVQTYVVTIHKYMDEMNELETHEKDLTIIDTIKQSLTKYESTFLSVIDLLEKRGFQDSGLEGQFRNSIHAIEDSIKMRNLDQLTIDMLTMRRNEKDYLLRNQEKYVKRLDEAVTNFKTNVAATNLNQTEKEQLVTPVNQYQTQFIQLVKIDQQIATSIETYRAAVHTLESPLEQMLANATKQENIARVNLQEIARLIFLIDIGLTLLIVIVGLLIAFALASLFSKPLILIAQSSKLLSKGNITLTGINRTAITKLITRKDEIGEIGQTFDALASYFQKVIEDITQVSQGLALGNLRVRPKAEYSGDFIQIKDALETTLSYLGDVIRDIVHVSQGLAEGNLVTTKAEYRGDFTQIKNALEVAVTKLADATTKNKVQDWLKSGQAQLNKQIAGEQEIFTMSKKIISFLTTYVEAQIGLFYMLTEEDGQQYLQIIASYAYIDNDESANKVLLTKGLAGQAALEQKIILRTQTPEECPAMVSSGLARSLPRHILLLPFLYENEVKGVIEIGSTTMMTDIQQSFLEQVMPNIGIAVNTAKSRSQMQTLLEQSQRQAKELQHKQTELQHTNEELQSQSEELQTQSEELQTQQEELRQTNEVLEKRTRDLERQKFAVQEKNQTLSQTQAEMEQAKKAIEAKAEELALASKYKSEFLANMSHELRTPLNSLLILAKLLADNKSNNLTAKQIEYAATIHSAGNDLLTLINDILDLSKIEAGKIEVQWEDVSLSDLLTMVDQKFRHIAENKGLVFHLILAEDIPSVLHTDGQRLKQIINNLLSNAFKFTNTGEIKVMAQRPTNIPRLSELGGNILEPTKTVAISVTDTGIGIASDKQQVIFEAFQQADGTTSRSYGGTGLGLSISRQLARLLGGELTLRSEEGKGTTFTLYLPIGKPQSKPNIDQISPNENQVMAENTFIQGQIVPENAVQPSNQVALKEYPVAQDKPMADDRNALQPSDKSILIIEDDQKFSNILSDLAHSKGFKCIIAFDGISGLQLVAEYKPHAIILDVGLPQLNGWSVMAKLKDNPGTRHIPVHFISAAELNMDAKKMGAIGYLTKPVRQEQIGEAFKTIEQFLTKTEKNLLIVVDNKYHQQKILDLVGGENIQIKTAATATTACQYLQTIKYDCIILDMDIEQGSGSKLLEQMQQKKGTFCQIPIIVYADRDLTPAEEALSLRCADELPIKSAQSPERLLDEATLFLHQVEANLPAEKRDMLRMIHDKTKILRHKKVLIIDDDMRNTFALTTVLEDYDMEVVIGADGKEGLTTLAENDDIAIVLMDIMMPEMDGYEAIGKIREQPHYRHLPIIALTAKAMKGDRAKCIEAGANDYLAKPVDTDKLLSLMRVWLYR